MRNQIFKYLFIAFFGFYFLLGFFAGNAISAVATHTLRKDISAGLAITAAVVCLMISLTATPLLKVVIRLFDRSSEFGGHSVLFWQIVLNVFGVFGVIFGSLLPNGPFQLG